MLELWIDCISGSDGQLHKMAWNFEVLEIHCNYHNPCIKSVVFLFWHPRKKLSVIIEPSLWEVHLEIFVDHCQLKYPFIPSKVKWTSQEVCRVLKKNNGRESSIQQFLSLYRIRPNPNTILGKSPAELIFSWKIWSVFDRLLLVRKKKKICLNNKNFKNTKYTPKYFRPRDKMFFFKCIVVQRNSGKRL